MCWIEWNKNKSKPISLCSSRLNRSFTITTEKQQSEATFAEKTRLRHKWKGCFRNLNDFVCQVGCQWRRTTSSTAGTPLSWTTSRGRRSSSGPTWTMRTCWSWPPCRWPSCWRKRWSSLEPTSTETPTVRGRRTGRGRGLQLPPGRKRRVVPPRWNLFLSLLFNHQVLNRFSFSIPFHPKQEVPVSRDDPREEELNICALCDITQGWFQELH